MEERRKHWMHSSPNNYKNNSCSHSGTYYLRNHNNIYSTDEVKPLSSNPNHTTVGTSTCHSHSHHSHSDDEAYTRENYIKSSHSSKYIQSPQDFMLDAANMACCPKTCRIILPGKRKPGLFDDLKKSDFFNCFGNFLTVVFLVLFILSILHYILSSDEVLPQEEQKENVTNITQPLVNQDDDDDEDDIAGDELETDDIDKTLEGIQAIENATEQILQEHHIEIHRETTIHHDMLGETAPIEPENHKVEHYIAENHHATIPTHHTSAAIAQQVHLPHTAQHHHKTEHHHTTVPHEHTQHHHKTEHHHTTVPHEHTQHHHKTEHHHTKVPQEHTQHHHKTEHHHTKVPQEHTQHHHKTEHHHTTVPHEHTQHHHKTEHHHTTVPHEHTQPHHKTEHHDHDENHHHKIVAPTSTLLTSHENTKHTDNTPPYRARKTITIPRSSFGFGSDHQSRSWLKFLLYGPP